MRFQCIAGPGFGPSNHYLTEKYVSFEPGDLFPLEDYIDLNGQTGNFEQLLGGKASIIMFVSFECSRCYGLLEIWQEHLNVRLLPEAQVIAALDNDFDGFPPEYAGLFKDLKVVTVDKDYWSEYYHISLWPTIVGVDESGFVVHVQPGFRDYIDFELVNFFLVSNQ